MAMMTLGALQEATGHDAASRFLEERILPGSGWSLERVRRRSVRLEPPHAYWATYRVHLRNGDEQERVLRLVARGIFDPESWLDYRRRVTDTFGERLCRPLDDLGYPVAFDESQHLFWFFPVDPAMPGLVQAADPAAMRRLFRNQKRDLLRYLGRVTDVRVEAARYLPEISAILRYDVDCVPAAASRTIFGKVQPGDRSAESHRVLEAIWRAAQASGGRLQVPEPLAHFPSLGLSLQASVPGASIGSDRTLPEFHAAAVHAAEALATLHDSAVATDRTLPLDREIARLERTLDQFALVHPTGYFQLRELLSHLSHHLRHLPEEEWLPTHGDFKYDQILHAEGGFHVIDFDFFGSAETSFDLGKFCAYLMPSMPKSWEQSAAAAEARGEFLRQYLRLRPSATIQRFPIYESINLAGRAMTLMWTQQEGWEKASETLLVLAMERLKSRVPEPSLS